MRITKFKIKESQLIDCQLWWQKQGLSQTSSGYGRKLSTRWKIKIGNRLHRIYCHCFSNSGSLYIVQSSRKITINLI